MGHVGGIADGGVPGVPAQVFAAGPARRGLVTAAALMLAVLCVVWIALVSAGLDPSPLGSPLSFRHGAHLLAVHARGA
jgi:hypothetical protein